MSENAITNEEAAAERMRLNLSAAEWIADSGIDFGQELGLLSVPDLSMLRMRLMDEFEVGKDYSGEGDALDRLITWLVEAVEHEIGGRWVRNHAGEVGLER
jgi:hypothetical protein